MAEGSSLPNIETPAWIEVLYKRGSAEHALHTSFLLNFTNTDIAREADSIPDGREQLRRVAIGELASGDPKVVALSLVFLGVVGLPEDLPKVEPLLVHPSDLVYRAARACTFELQHTLRG